MVGMNPPHSPYRSLDDCMEEDFNLYKDQPIDSLLIRPNADRQREKLNQPVIICICQWSRPCFRTNSGLLEGAETR